MVSVNEYYSGISINRLPLGHSFGYISVGGVAWETCRKAAYLAVGLYMGVEKSQGVLD